MVGGLEAVHRRPDEHQAIDGVRMGQGEVHLGYDRSKLDHVTAVAGSPSNSVWKAAATYQYNLSKRTAMYGTVAILDNGDFSVKSVSPQGTGAPNGTYEAGGKSKGFEVGIRHFF